MRLYNPNISSDGNRIVAVSFTENRHSLLVILNAKTGEIIDRVEVRNGGFIMSQSWSENDAEIVFTSQKFKGRGIYIYHPDKREFEKVKPESWMPVYKPVINGEYIIYDSQIDGVENLVAIHRKDKREYQVTSRKYGASNFSRTQDGVYYLMIIHPRVMPFQSWISNRASGRKYLQIVRIQFKGCRIHLN